MNEICRSKIRRYLFLCCREVGGGRLGGYTIFVYPPLLGEEYVVQCVVYGEVKGGLKPRSGQFHSTVWGLGRT